MNQDISSARWWEESSDDELFKMIKSSVASCTADAQQQRDCCETNLEIYTNGHRVGLTPATYEPFDVHLHAPTSNAPSMRPTANINVTASIINTIYNDQGKTDSTIRFLTEGGTFDEKRRCKALDKNVQKLSNITNISQLQRECLKFALVTGTSFLRITGDASGISISRIMPFNILVDRNAAFDGDPQHLHVISWIDADMLAAQFKKSSKQYRMVMDAAGVSFNSIISPSLNGQAKLVEIIESFKLPSGYRGSPFYEDGVVITSCPLGILSKRPLKKKRYPFATLHWEKPIVGMFGTGVPAHLVDMQMRMNSCTEREERAMDLTCRPIAVVKDANDLKSIPQSTRSSVDNTFGAVYSAGSLPEFIFQSAVPPQFAQYREYLRAMMYETEGQSQSGAAGLSPMGPDASGRAIREANSIQDNRYAVNQKQYEEFQAQCAVLLLDAALDAIEAGCKLPIEGPREWLDIDTLPNHVIRSQVSALGRTPAAKIDNVQKLVDLGIIPPEKAPALLDFPDTESFVAGLTANDKLSERIAAALSDATAAMPQPQEYYDLPVIHELIRGHLIQADADGAGPDIIDRFRAFLANTKALIAELAPVLPATQQAPTPQQGQSI